jgi:broad specificity phosphatase PhoE
VVAHYGVNRSIIGHLLSHREPGFAKIDQDFGCVNVVDLAGDQTLLRVLNFTAHDPLKASMAASSADLWYEQARRSLS